MIGELLNFSVNLLSVSYHVAPARFDVRKQIRLLHWAPECCKACKVAVVYDEQLIIWRQTAEDLEYMMNHTQHFLIFLLLM